jgi:hypothetical protein
MDLRIVVMASSIPFIIMGSAISANCGRIKERTDSLSEMLRFISNWACKGVRPTSLESWEAREVGCQWEACAGSEGVFNFQTLSGGTIKPKKISGCYVVISFLFITVFSFMLLIVD